VLALLVEGRINKQAAYELGIGEKTVKVYCPADGKDGAPSLVELARAADKAGISLSPGQSAARRSADIGPKSNIAVPPTAIVSIQRRIRFRAAVPGSGNICHEHSQAVRRSRG
jgi:hypothetical protein